MILRCNFEELRALKEGARVYLAAHQETHTAVAAPSEDRMPVESVASQLSGDFAPRTPGELDTLIRGVSAIADRLRFEMESVVSATHPADEGAVSAYFDYAHSHAVLSRLREMYEEMVALVELMNGRPVTSEDLKHFVFPD